jgi:osmotically-inducible protein OsmY
MMMTAIGALMASMVVVGCSKQDQADAKTATSDAVAAVKQDAREVGAEAAKGMEKAKETLASSTQEAKDDAKTAGGTIGDKVDDAVITASVKAELAKDAALSVLKINVDTDHGRVALRGTTASAAARDRALALAGGVKGVVSVDNQLMVEAGKS